MQVEIIPIFSDNYAYLVACPTTGQAAVVDPAEPGPVLEVIERRDVKLTALWNTHHHWDHTAGNEKVLEAYPDLAVYGHREDATRITGLNHPVDDDDLLSLGELSVRVLHTPGHTRGGIVYLVEGAAFTGDALFCAGCGRLFEGDPPTMYRSLNERIGSLPDDTRIFCGHEYTQKNLAFARTVEPDNERLHQRIAEVDAKRARGEPSIPSTLGEERATNPFLRCDSPEIRRGLAERFPGEPLDEPQQVFAKLRELRDGF